MADPLPPSTEWRPKRRQRVLLGGIIASTDESQCFKCSIRDISETGARLIHGGQQVPCDFYLIHIRDRVVYEAKLIWKSEREVGVAFKKHFRLSDIVDPAQRFLTRIWFAQVND